MDIVELFKQMIRLDTTNPPGNEYLMTDLISAVLAKEGIWHKVQTTAEGRTNLIARIGVESELPPIILISHTDVVGCENQAWKHPPFEAVEEDRIIYGRGTVDTKHLTAMQLGALLALKDHILNRAVYLLATSDEEQGSSLGMPRLVQQYGDLFKRGLVINEGGGFCITHQGNPYWLCTVGEKGRIEVKVTIEGASGPASFKSENKAVDTFIGLLDHLGSYQFPAVDTAVHRLFTEVVGTESTHSFLNHFRWYNSHDAIILQRYDIGTQVNVLPYRIEFEFSLQLLPGRSEQEARSLLASLFAGTGVSYEVLRFDAGFESDCTNRFYKTMETLVQRHYGADRLIPVYALGRTDGRFLGPLPSDVYGFSPVTDAIPFETILKLVHQVDERIDRDSIVKGTRFLTDLIQTMGNC